MMNQSQQIMEMLEEKPFEPSKGKRGADFGKGKRLPRLGPEHKFALNDLEDGPKTAAELRIKDITILTDLLAHGKVKTDRPLKGTRNISLVIKWSKV